MNLPKKKTNTLERGMSQILLKMDMMDPLTDEYRDALADLEHIKEVNDFINNKRGRRQLDKTELVKTGMVIVGGLVELFCIMHYEEISAFTTKAFGKILKPKL